MLGFPLGVLTVNGLEWVLHKHVLHGTPRPGQGRYSPRPTSMKSHWAHHKQVRVNRFYDDAYTEGWKNWRYRNEVESIIALTVVTSPIAVVAPFYYAGMVYAGVNYFLTHRKAHLDTEWAKKNVPWHYDHHMNSNQDANWCVTRPWFDYIMGTRVASSPELMESNPLGIKLPSLIEAPLNRIARKLMPSAFERLDSNMRMEKDNRQKGIELPMPE